MKRDTCVAHLDAQSDHGVRAVVTTVILPRPLTHPSQVDPSQDRLKKQLLVRRRGATRRLLDTANQASASIIASERAKGGVLQEEGARQSASKRDARPQFAETMSQASATTTKMILSSHKYAQKMDVMQLSRQKTYRASAKNITPQQLAGKRVVKQKPEADLASVEITSKSIRVVMERAASMKRTASARRTASVRRTVETITTLWMASIGYLIVRRLHNFIA